MYRVIRENYIIPCDNFLNFLRQYFYIFIGQISEFGDSHEDFELHSDARKLCKACLKTSLKSVLGNLNEYSGLPFMSRELWKTALAGNRTCMLDSLSNPWKTYFDAKVQVRILFYAAKNVENHNGKFLKLFLFQISILIL